MKVKASTIFCAASAVMVGLALNCGTAAAQSCGPAVEAAKAEWRSLAHGNHTVPAAMRINTSDGRQLAGSTLNYAWVLIDRADQACIDPEPAKSAAYLSEEQALLHPPARLP